MSQIVRYTCSKCCYDPKVCLTILGQYALKRLKLFTIGFTIYFTTPGVSIVEVEEVI